MKYEIATTVSADHLLIHVIKLRTSGSSSGRKGRQRRLTFTLSDNFQKNLNFKLSFSAQHYPIFRNI